MESVASLGRLYRFSPCSTSGTDLRLIVLLLATTNVIPKLAALVSTVGTIWLTGEVLVALQQYCSITFAEGTG